MAKKEIHYPYYCRKCTRTVYFNENDIINDICKICGNKMDAGKPFVTHPKQTLSNTNRKGSSVTMDFHQSKPTVECPYCHSTDTKKITNTSKAVHTALFGIFSVSRNSKQWHCNNCNSDF